MALRSDVEDIQGGTTREGIHMGVMSGTVDLMQGAYPGTEIRDGVLRFQPRLPAAVEQVAFRMQFHRTPLQVTLDHARLAITIDREGAGGPIRVGVGDEVRELCPGDTETFELFDKASSELGFTAAVEVIGSGFDVSSTHNRRADSVKSRSRATASMAC